MSATDFPSGLWTGYYQYSNGQRGEQDLLLEFQSGRITGSGNDELGVFEVQGTFDDTAKEAEWLKLYPDGHRVAYRGFREGPVTGIWGVWTIPDNWSGGFHIWPLQFPLGGAAAAAESVPHKTTRPQPVTLPG